MIQVSGRLRTEIIPCPFAAGWFRLAQYGEADGVTYRRLSNARYDTRTAAAHSMRGRPIYGA